MLTIKELTDKPCFICGASECNADVKMKDGTFTGVICKDDLWKILRRKSRFAAQPKTNDATNSVHESESEVQ